MANKKRKPSATRKGPASRPASKSRKDVRAKVSDADRVTTVDRTGKRKGRLKQNTEDDLKPVYQYEPARTVRQETTTGMRVAKILSIIAVLLADALSLWSRYG